MTETLLALSGLTKAYPGVVANDEVSFDIARGEIHALLGENGAGKSTLVKMIYGLVSPDSGHMTLDGVAFRPANPHAARALGVAMVFQHFSLFEALSVSENIALGMENPPKMRDLARQITTVLKDYGLPLDPARVVGDLSAGERQRVEIIRCLLQNPRLLIMDEPTSVLTPQEVDILFQTLKKLRAGGVSILYISHKLEEIRTLCDTATVLRLGKRVGTFQPSRKSAAAMAKMMVGADLHQPQPRAHDTGPLLLEVRALTQPTAGAFGTTLTDINLSIHAGEILGIGGVAGNGQSELMSALSGEVLSDPDAIQFKAKHIGQLGPNARRKLGLLCAPEERLGHAAAPEMSLTENALLTAQTRERLVTGGFIQWSKTDAFATTVIDRFDVRTPSSANLASALSGGNLQKFVIGREILQRPEVLVVNQPTWGVDAAAAAAIRQALLDLAANGAAVMVISQDLDEVMQIADRFAALNAGRLTGSVSTQGLSTENIGMMMGGSGIGDASHV